jgi:predicted Zn-dependent protease
MIASLPKSGLLCGDMMPKKLLIGCVLCVLLAGCATAVSRTPQISKQELQQEQQEQEALVRQSQNASASRPQETRPEMLERLKKVGFTVMSAGKQVCVEIHGGNRNCSFALALDKDSENAINAYTDGQKIVVSPAMMRFAEDDELAVVVSHEYAHTVMAHPSKTQTNASMGGLLGMAADMLAQSQGINTGGAFGKLGVQGAVMRYSQDFEREADYIGMYILARTGIPTAEAARFWRRMAAVNPDGIYSASTHPTTAERYILLKKTAAEIADKKSTGQPLLPEKLPEA